MWLTASDHTILGAGKRVWRLVGICSLWFVATCTSISAEVKYDETILLMSNNNVIIIAQNHSFIIFSDNNNTIFLWCYFNFVYSIRIQCSEYYFYLITTFEYFPADIIICNRRSYVFHYYMYITFPQKINKIPLC